MRTFAHGEERQVAAVRTSELTRRDLYVLKLQNSPTDCARSQFGADSELRQQRTAGSAGTCQPPAGGTRILCCQTTIMVFLHKLTSYKLQQRHCQKCEASKRNSGFIPSRGGLTQMFTAAKRLGVAQYDGPTCRLASAVVHVNFQCAKLQGTLFRNGFLQSSPIKFHTHITYNNG
jgi:hypothetical protein